MRRMLPAFPLAALVALIAAAPASGATDCDGLAPTQPPGTDAGEVILGTSGPDVIIAEGGDDVVAGFGGGDVICGGDGDDIIYGGDSSGTASGGTEGDLLIGDDGNDIIAGELGNDGIAGFAGRDTIFGGPQNDFIFGGDTTFTESGGTEADLLLGEDGDDQVLGELGGDRIWGGAGADFLDGQDGDQDRVMYSFAAGPVEVDLEAGTATGDGTDTLAGFEEVLGSPAGDLIEGDAGDNALDGNDGDDTLDGRDGIDTADFSSADAGVTADLAAGEASGADSGNDDLLDMEYLAGSAFGDTLLGDEGENGFFPGEGDDVVDGRGEAELGDVVSFNTAALGVQADLAAGTATGEGTDELADIEGMIGSQFDDELRGDDQNNGIAGAGGDDILDGRGGDADNAFFSHSVNEAGERVGVQVHLAGGTAIGNGRDSLAGFETVSGTDASDIIAGDGKANALTGNGGDDFLFGRGGHDLLDPGAGDDALFGGESAFDQVSYVRSPAGARVDLSAGRAVVGGGSEEDDLAGVEVVFGSRFNDVLIGDSGENIFFTGAGSDRVIGGLGADTVAYWATTGGPFGAINFASGPVTVDLSKGTATNDVEPGDTDRLSQIEDIWGSELGDTLIGDDGRNLFMAGAGDDTVLGRGGDDSLNGERGNDRLRGQGGRADFTYYHFSQRVDVDLRRGKVEVTGDGSVGARASNRHRGLTDTDDLGGVEAVSGSEGDDVIRGSRRDDILFGRGGRDKLRGRGGSDVLDGDKGRDKSFGGRGVDFCLERRRFGCERKALPADLRADVRRLIAQILRDIKRRRGVRLSG